MVTLPLTPPLLNITPGEVCLFEVNFLDDGEGVGREGGEGGGGG